MPLLRIGKKVLKIFWICAGSLIILLTAFHFWVVYHAEEIIQELVESKSNGKLKLEVKNFKFNWFSRKMELNDAVFYSTDSVNSATTYRFAVRKINLKVSAVWPVIFEKRVLINNLELKDPDITVTRLRAAKDKDKTEDLSVPQEMGRIYQSIQDALEVLKVKKFELDNASFSLINKVRPDQQTISISHIDLTIHDLQVDNSKLTGREKIFFSDNIVLKSRDQDILFPDRRHRLAFQKFRVNIEKKIVEFDSCTIAAVKTDKSPTGFSIFFDKLVMTNIDFDTLYRAEVIKADSVYCINPVFKLTADLDKRKAKKAAPKLDEIIRKLTGDLMLNFVVVNNASFDINTVRNGNPSSFRSQRNNFEMQGLRIDNDAVRPLTVEKFAMAIRDYENFLRDSLYSLQFDSIQVNNNKIFLNNFSFQRLINGKPVSNFSVPQFQLTGLSWDDLLFERKLTAHQAVLFNPVIDYHEWTKSNPKRTRRSIFEVLSNINDVLMLEDMRIINGDINVHLDDGTMLQLKKATVSVESRALLRSNQYAGIRRSVNYLDFSKGLLRINDLTIQLDSINYTGEKSRLKARTATIRNDQETINAIARDVVMNEIFINEFTGDVSMAGIKWEKADINIVTRDKDSAGKKAGVPFISLTDIDGNNTVINAISGDNKFTAFIDHIRATAFLLKPGERPVIAGLDLAGSAFNMQHPVNEISVGRFNITDGQNAVLDDIHYKRQSASDSADVSIESISFVPNVQLAIDKEIKSGAMTIRKPVVKVHSGMKEQNIDTTLFLLPKGSIDELVIEQPVIDFSKQNGQGTWKFYWDGSGKDQQPLKLSNIYSDAFIFSASQLELQLKNFFLETTTGKKFNSGKGEITAKLKDLSLEQEKNKEWKATIDRLVGKDFIFDSLGRKNGRLEIKNWLLSNVSLNNNSSKSLRSLSAVNKDFKIGQLTAGFINNDDRFEWHNVSYDKSTRVFMLDSFLYNPVHDADAFIKRRKFQTDYIRLRTGGVIIEGFDPDAYFADSVVRVRKIAVQDIVFNDFRDKRPPFREGIIKPLSAGRIKSIPFKVAVDSLLLQNAHVTYAELSPKTNQTGTIPITRINLTATPIRNFGLGVNDSLYIRADGYLMDTAFLRLRLHESYYDSLTGFLLTARISPADLRVMNPVLIPLSSVKLRSGILDSLLLRVNGDEYYAYGELVMHYHDLKIQLLQAPDEKRKKFKMTLVNFLANSLVVRNKNTQRNGLVFFVRDRERSSLNYLVKMLMSGVNSSIGIKTTRKNLQPHKKEVKQRNLPPANYD